MSFSEQPNPDLVLKKFQFLALQEHVVGCRTSGKESNTLVTVRVSGFGLECPNKSILMDSQHPQGPFRVSALAVCHLSM